MCLQGADELLLVLSDLGGDDGKDTFFVISEEGDDVVLDVQLAQVPQDEGLSIMQFALTADCICLHLLDLLVYSLEGVSSIGTFGCSPAIGHVCPMKWRSQSYAFINGLLYTSSTGF